MKVKNFSIPVQSNKKAEAVLMSYDKTNIAPNPFRKMDWEIDSIMREIEG